MRQIHKTTLQKVCNAYARRLAVKRLSEAKAWIDEWLERSIVHPRDAVVIRLSPQTLFIGEATIYLGNLFVREGVRRYFLNLGYEDKGTDPNVCDFSVVAACPVY